MKKYIIISSSIYFIVMVLLSSLISINWIGMQIAWIIGGIIIYKKIGLENILKLEKTLWFGNFYIYPLILTLLKILIIWDIVPGSWAAINSIEHISWSLAVFTLLFPLYHFLNSKFELSLLFIAGIVTIIGNINEIAQLYLRNLANAPTWRIAAYYKDTINDLTMNVIGVLLGFIIFWAYRRFRQKRTDKI